MTAFWQVLADVLVLLVAALLLGSVAERLRQSALLGYLLAGVLLSPRLVTWVGSEDLLRGLAELGVALLLFAVGLEFSLRRLLRLGRVALAGGALQILVTLGATTGAVSLLGLGLVPALVVGAAVALSSTAAVLRVLSDRAELDSPHGRNALGILLTQDLAVVPLVVLVAGLGTGGGAITVLLALLRSLGLAALFSAALFLLAAKVLPILLASPTVGRSRELAVLFAAVLALGATWAAHALGLSPALGAFVAGLALAESPFALRIRTDIGALRAILLAVFFGSVGMLADPGWILPRLPVVAALTAGILVVKGAIAGGAVNLLGRPRGEALATGLVLAQTGEFTLLLAEQAWAARLLPEAAFQLLVSSTLLSLLLTPLLAVAASRIRCALPTGVEETPPLRDHVIVAGYGPAGSRAARALAERGERVLVIDLASANVDAARRDGHQALLGDAAAQEVLEHGHAGGARAVVLSLPDHRTNLAAIERLRDLARGVPVFVRARYGIHLERLRAAGARVVDEESEVGRQLAERAAERIGPPPPPAV